MSLRSCLCPTHLLTLGPDRILLPGTARRRAPARVGTGFSLLTSARCSNQLVYFRPVPGRRRCLVANTQPWPQPVAQAACQAAALHMAVYEPAAAAQNPALARRWPSRARRDLRPDLRAPARPGSATDESQSILRRILRLLQDLQTEHRFRYTATLALPTTTPSIPLRRAPGRLRTGW